MSVSVDLVTVLAKAAPVAGAGIGLAWMARNVGREKRMRPMPPGLARYPATWTWQCALAVVFFGGMAMMLVVVEPHPWLALIFGVSTLIAVWGLAATRRSELRWDAEGLTQIRVFRAQRRFLWSALRDTRHSDVWRRHRLDFRPQGHVTVEDDMIGAEALVDHAKAVLRVRPADRGPD